jgi:hypothetical protein
MGGKPSRAAPETIFALDQRFVLNLLSIGRPTLRYHADKAEDEPT